MPADSGSEDMMTRDLKVNAVEEARYRLDELDEERDDLVLSVVESAGFHSSLIARALSSQNPSQSFMAKITGKPSRQKDTCQIKTLA